MPSRKEEAWIALQSADKAAVEAYRAFHNEMGLAFNSKEPMPPAPWYIPIMSYLAMKEAEKLRRRAYHTWGAIITTENNEE